MRLIEIAGFVDGVENGDTLFEEIRRVSGAFDLTDSAEGHTRRSQKMTLSGPQGQRLPLAAHRRIHDEVTSNDSLLEQAS